MAALLTVSACTSDVPGNPSPTQKSSSSSNTGAALPKRPTVLKLDGVDPCKLLTASQMDEIKVATARARESKAVDQKSWPGCSFDNNLQYAYQVATITGKGVDYWGAGGNVDVKPAEVAGFGAVQITFLGTNNVDCSLAVDVADGQHLFMSYRPTVKEGESQQQMCDNVKNFAGLVLATLKTLK